MLKLILLLTICAPDLGAMESAYTSALNFSVVERGTIPASLASVWAAPKMRGHAYILMRSKDDASVYLRFVQLDEAPSYRPMSTFGWNAFELPIADPEIAAAKLGVTGLDLGGELPADATKVVGPANEVLVLTPVPAASHRPVRLFLGTPDLPMTQRFFRERLGLKGSAVESFAMKARRRPQRKGELAPALSVVSFEIDSLESVAGLLLAQPKRIGSAPYKGRRVGAVRGTSLEIIEVVESP